MTTVNEITIVSKMLTKRGIDQITKEANRRGAIELHDQIPDHFAENAQQRFKYKQRTRKYNQRKQREYGHTKALVFTGELQRAVISSRKVTATQKQGKVTARGSRESNLRNQYATEIETVTKKQDRQLSRNWRDNFVSLAGQDQYQKTVRR